MGFGGFLKGLAGIGANFIPGGGITKGVLGKVLSGAAKSAPIIAGMAGGRAEGRQEDLANRYAYDRLNLDRARMGQDALQQEFGNRLALNRIQSRRAAAGANPRLHLGAQPDLPTAPTASPLPMISAPPNAGFMDKLLSVAGPATALAGAFQHPTGTPGAPSPYGTPPLINPIPRRYRPGVMGPAQGQAPGQFMGWGG